MVIADFHTARKFTNHTPTLGARKSTGKRFYQYILAITTTFALLKLRKRCGSSKLIRKRSHQGFINLKSDENSSPPGAPLVQDAGDYWPPYPGNALVTTEITNDFTIEVFHHGKVKSL